MEVRLFFEFLQVTVGNRKSLSVAINDSDWRMLFDFCKRQALIGVGFTAVEKLHAVGVVCPANLRMQWMALALQIEKRNALLNEQCRKLTEQYGHDGLSTCILKGQGNCLNYPEELRNRRQCGDIDIWATTKNGRQHGQHETTFCPQADGGGEQQLTEIGQQLTEIGPQADGGIAIAVQTGKNEVEYVEYHGRKAVIEYVRMQHRLAGNNEKLVIRYHHIDAPKIDGTEVEVHFRPCFTHSPLRNWRMQRWFDAHADVCMKNKTQMGVAVPTASVNVVYQMCHLFSHYFDEGVGLRQLMDYYFALRLWHNDVMECKDLQSQGMWSDGMGTPVMSKEEVMSVLRSFGMAKFAGAVMWVINEVFVGGNDNDNENEKSPQMNTDGHGCPQADFMGEQQFPSIGQQLKENGPQADSKGRQRTEQRVENIKYFLDVIPSRDGRRCNQQEQHKTTFCQQADGESEHEFTRIIREFKENNIYPQINTDGHRCPQADGGGEQQLSAIGQQLKEICPQADGRSEHELLRIDRELKENNYVPWMICEPNEFEGKRLLAEIMRGGNFGQYDTRDAGLKRGGMVKHGVWKLKRVMRLVSSYPEEALWEPAFRMWHLLWRIANR